MALRLFEAFGIELEYMLVDATTFDVRPMSDTLLARINDGVFSSDVVRGPVTWSNELTMHVIELKCSQPTNRLLKLSGDFEKAIRAIQPELQRCHLRLLPSAMHPWMDPRQSVVLWPHEDHEIYAAFDRHFDCRSHGWGNVQSVHLNLPFEGDDEFYALHSAIRLVLPLLPALTASSPVINGQASPLADTRLREYAAHCDAMPCLTGDVIPDTMRSREEYEQRILHPIVAEHKRLALPEFMRPEFMNARGAIARFDRNSIEIRVMDVQEYPGADVAICAAIISLLRMLVGEKWSSLAAQSEIATTELRRVLDAVMTGGDQAIIDSPELLKCFAIEKPRMRAGELWTHLLREARRHDSNVDNLFAPLEIIAQHGCLATRITRAIDGRYDHERILDVYAQLADCLDRWEPFQP